jgi:hypothetical protein
VQDPDFTAMKQDAFVSGLPFKLHIPEAATDRHKLLSETPCGTPFSMTPASFEVRSGGGAFASFQAPVTGSDNRVRLLTLHFRRGGTEGIGLMTCGYASMFSIHSAS